MTQLGLLFSTVTDNAVFPQVRSVGEIAKLAFTEFIDGRTPADVLMKYSFDLALIERLYEDSKVMRGTLLDCKRCREGGRGLALTRRYKRWGR